MAVQWGAGPYAHPARDLRPCSRGGLWTTLGPVELDRSGREVLAREECLELLASVRIGRVGFSAGALPVILPVAFALEEQAIVVRVRGGSQLHGAIRDAVVAFEVDGADRDEGGWSVAVTGVATEVVDPRDLARVRRLPLDVWSATAADHFVRITVDLVSGRRAHRTALAGAQPAQGRTE